MAEARDKNQLGTVNLLAMSLAFNLAGHVNHTVFWPSMSPDGGDKPDGDLAAAIEQDFGSFDAFRAHFTANATGIQGSGWLILARDSAGQRLLICQLYDPADRRVALLSWRRDPTFVAMSRSSGEGYSASASSASLAPHPYRCAVSIRVTPSSTARRATAMADSRAGAGDVGRCIAPNPSRRTPNSPPTWKVLDDIPPVSPLSRRWSR